MRSLGPYDLLEEIGRGGMGRVYRALHRPTRAVRAVKLLDGSPDPESVVRFRREAEALGRLGGVGVVPVHETGVEGRQLYFAMDLMPGGSLAARVKQRGSLPWREAVALAIELARTLERCHAIGLVHRDLKPDNVLFDEQGSPRVADFGCVRDLGAASLTETGTILGTPGYMAPEQLAGEKADARSDVYALGAILHELIEGERPYQGRSLFEIHRQAAAGARSPLGREAPAALETAVARALAPRREDRFESAGPFGRALESLGEPRPSSRRGTALAILIALVAAAVLVRVATRSHERPPGVIPTDLTPTSRSLALAADLLGKPAPITSATFPIEHVARLAADSAPELGAIAEKGVVYDLEDIRRVARTNPDAPGVRLLLAFGALATRRGEDRAEASRALSSAPRGALADGLARALKQVDQFLAKGPELGITALVRDAKLPGLAALNACLRSTPLPPRVLEGLLEPITECLADNAYMNACKIAGANETMDHEGWSDAIRTACDAGLRTPREDARLPARFLVALDLDRDERWLPETSEVVLRRGRLASAIEIDDPVLAAQGQARALLIRNVTLWSPAATDALFEEAATIEQEARALLDRAPLERPRDRSWRTLIQHELDVMRRERLRARWQKTGSTLTLDEAIAAARTARGRKLVDSKDQVLLGSVEPDTRDLLRVLIEGGRAGEFPPEDFSLVSDDVVSAEYARASGDIAAALHFARRAMASRDPKLRWNGEAVTALVHAAQGDSGAATELPRLLGSPDFAPAMLTLNSAALEKALARFAPVTPGRRAGR